MKCGKKKMKTGGKVCKTKKMKTGGKVKMRGTGCAKRGVYSRGPMA